MKPLGNVREQVTRSDVAAFRKDAGMSFRVRPSAVVDGPLDEGSLDLPGDFSLARALTSHKLKFTLTGPHMLCKTLLDNHYGSYADLSNALADVLAAQVAEIDADAGTGRVIRTTGVRTTKPRRRSAPRRGYV
ncbi:MAG TPA: hypothetical protein EYQ31_16785 [Candidatus Handelsmanbacteria bacterium]|nr:hypothetical protein [Candidatus Handelsmanbacteria bacterium]